MKPVAEQPKAPQSKQRSRPGAKDDLRSLSPPEVQKKVSSPEGLRQDEA
jgi:hypothetical protein